MATADQLYQQYLAAMRAACDAWELARRTGIPAVDTNGNPLFEPGSGDPRALSDFNAWLVANNLTPTD